ncbi:MAG: c-type cytochrome domain-containing protein [Verrucomicrobiota bacterium]
MPPAYAAGKKDDTTSQAMEVLRVNCLSCHNDEKEKGGLSLATRERALKGGDNGPAFKSGKPDASALVKALAADADPHMPPKKQLADNQINLLKSWVKAGAKWDAAALAETGLTIKPVTLTPLPASYHPVLALALSPDAKSLAVARANRISICAVGQTNQPVLHELQSHPDPVQSLAWSADGKWLASGSFRRVILWNTAGFNPAREITEGLMDRITALEFTPDGATLIAADGFTAQSGFVRLVESASGKAIASWQAHNDTIFDLSLSKDGKLLSTASGDKLVKVWELDSRKELARLEGHTSAIYAVAFNGEGTQLVSGGPDKEIKVWDVKTREKVATLGDNPKAGITALAWTPDSKNVFAANESGVVFNYTELKTHTGAERSSGGRERTIGSGTDILYSLAATPDAKTVYAGAHDGSVLFWTDGKSGRFAVVEPAVPAPITAR